MNLVAECYGKLIPDDWRTSFSEDIEQAHIRMFEAGADDAAIAAALQTWLEDFQPCLFGRIAAQRGALRFCILQESDLTASDAHIQAKIQRCREDWFADAYDAKTSGFVIAAVSERLARALPDKTVFVLAQRLASLYLLEEVVPDRVYHDRIHLERPGPRRRTWLWKVGANYFASHGDQRWWHDHRIPGGMAFSMNSVGHMMKATAINKSLHALDCLIGSVGEQWQKGTNFTSLEVALFSAMRTIDNAAAAVSGPATWLRQRSETTSPCPCPFTLPKDIAAFDPCEYRGYYDTDVTIPTEYFSSAVERPEGTPEHEMYFTYLFDRTDLDFTPMGEGLPVRDGEPFFAETEAGLERRTKMVPQEGTVESDPVLEQGLRRRGRD
jgi:hypothetical protein